MGNTTAYTYDAMGNLTGIRYPNGSAEERVYRNGNLAEHRRADGSVMRYSYDANGNCICMENSAGEKMTIAYDALNRRERVTNPDGGIIRYAYDAVGNITKMTDALGRETRYAYTPNGNLSSVTDALGNETRYAYDSMGRLVKAERIGDVTDGVPAGGEAEIQTTAYRWNRNGLVASVTDPLGAEESFGYDKNGRMTDRWDRDGYHTAYRYDGRGLLQDIFYGDGNRVSYHYDALGRLEEARDAAGATKIVSDALGRVVSVSGPDGKTVGYEWGSMGERRRLTYPDGREALYGYNEKGQLKRIRHTGKGIGEEYLYHYDKAGNKTGAEKKRQGMEADSGLFGYRYDALNRLTEVSRDGQLLRKYAYDAFGNRTLKEDYSSGEPVQTTYRYNGANQLISHVEEEGRQDYAYDRRGNLTAVSRGEERLKAFTFDAANRMDSALQVKGGTERRVKYQYDAFGNRTGQTVYSGAAGSGIHGIPDMGIPEPKDPEKQICYTIDLTRQYRNVLAAEDNAGQKAQTFYWDGNVAAMEEAGQDSYYLQDDLGSPMHLLDGDGEVRESYGFDEFGQALFPYEERQAQPFGYTGYQMEEAGGLYFAQARRYDAGAGRFVSEDVVKGHVALPYMLNSYTYCWNRPLEHVDLDGRIPEEIVGEENSDYVAAVYLVNESGALGQGHAALLLMQDNGNAEFYSYAGKVTPKAFTLGSEGYLSTHVDSFGVPSTISIEDFINNSGAYADNVYNKGVNLSEIDSYTNGVYIPISNDEGIAMHNMAMEIRSEPGKYNLWNHNCGQVAQIILQAGEKDFAKTTFAWWDTRPNSVYDNIVEEIEKGDRPGWRYGSIGELMLLDNNNDNCIDGE